MGQPTYTWQWKMAAHAPWMDLKWIISASFNYFQLLDHSSFFGIWFIGTITKTTFDSQHVVNLTDHYWQLTRAIPIQKITLMYLATILFNIWILLYVMLNSLLTDTFPKVVNNCSALISPSLRIKKLTTTAYFPHTNGQVERFNRTSVARMCHYDSEHRSDSDTYKQSLPMPVTQRLIERQKLYALPWYHRMHCLLQIPLTDY